MPLIIDRRSFLGCSLQGAAAAAFSSRLAFSQPVREMRWALLADTHIAADKADEYRGFHPHANLKQALEQIQTGSFDMVLVNGDLARSEGEPGDYEMFRDYVASVTENHPLAIALGNHDDRKNARAALASISGDVQHVERKLVTTIETEVATFLLLDSLMVTNIAAGQRRFSAKMARRVSGAVSLQTHRNLRSPPLGLG